MARAPGLCLGLENLISTAKLLKFIEYKKPEGANNAKTLKEVCKYQFHRLRGRIHNTIKTNTNNDLEMNPQCC